MHQGLQKHFGIQLFFADAYLDPFCFGAIVPHFIEIERTRLFKLKPFSKPDLVIVAVYLALVSEWLLPRISDRFTPDIFDVLSIFFGCIWFFVTSKDSYGRAIQKPVQ